MDEFEIVVRDGRLEDRVRLGIRSAPAQELLDEPVHLRWWRRDVRNATALDDPDAPLAEAARVGHEAPHEDAVRREQILHPIRSETWGAPVRGDGVLHLADLVPTAHHALALEDGRDLRLFEPGPLDGQGRVHGADAVSPAKLHLRDHAGQPLDPADHPLDLGQGSDDPRSEREGRTVDGAPGHAGDSIT